MQQHDCHLNIHPFILLPQIRILQYYYSRTTPEKPFLVSRENVCKIKVLGFSLAANVKTQSSMANASGIGMILLYGGRSSLSLSFSPVISPFTPSVSHTNDALAGKATISVLIKTAANSLIKKHQRECTFLFDENFSSTTIPSVLSKRELIPPLRRMGDTVAKFTPFSSEYQLFNSIKMHRFSWNSNITCREYLNKQNLPYANVCPGAGNQPTWGLKIAKFLQLECLKLGVFLQLEVETWQSCSGGRLFSLKT